MELDALKLCFLMLPLLVLMLAAGALLAFCKKNYALLFLISFNALFCFNLVASDFNSFGFFKYASLSLFLSLIALMYGVLPKRHSLTQVLLTFACLLILYGLLAVMWGVIKGQQFSLRGSIGINGPIVFGQLMITASVIFLLYGYRRFVLAAISAGLSLLSFSKGPIVAGLFVFFLRRKAFVIVLGFFVGIIFMFLPPDVLDNRIISFSKSIVSSVASGDYELLFSGANYGSIGARLEQYILAGRLLGEFPSGIGFGRWSVYSVHEYPHNFFVEILVEQGWVLGGCSLLIILLSYFKLCDRRIKYLFLMFLLFSMFSGSVLDNKGVYMAVFLGLLYRDGFLLTDEQKPTT
ncbi:hypothetical protein [Pseudomonas sp. BNK-15]|uniref:hypothetical protein n=1 Tax=Pseudomonas sp. BNK-15 TaxID=3376152 RepID=UPI0039BF87B6